MRKFVLLAALLAMLIVAALPTFAAADNNHNDNNKNHHNNNHNNNGGGGSGDPAITQDNEQDTESGDLNQSFNVTGGGDNSNQCVGGQVVGNTGNAQNQIPIIQYASEAGDFKFDDTRAKIDVSPTNTTSCDQQVNQAASASGDSPGTGGTPVKKK
jgi:hypothetical protein